jgi:CHAT domain-containing protein
MLFSVPWHGLPALAGRSVSVVPSMTIWLRANGRARSDGAVVLVAGPGLPGAAAEVATIARRFASARTLTGSRALVGDVGRALDGARIAHVACHGTFRADNPSFSSLELWDGPLTVLDIERLRRAPELVVLAACDSGVSQVLPGDELLGLVSALLSVGTRAVVASVVPVPDVESTPLMVGLHEELSRGTSIADALGAARAVLDIDSPAGFVTSLAFGCFGAGDVIVGGLS